MTIVSAPVMTPVWRVVVVDDSPDDRAEVRRLFLKGSERRFKFVEAETGANAIDVILNTAAGLPDCVVLDYHLPDMDAVEVLDALKGPNGLLLCPVVVLTGTTGQENTRAVLRAGAQDYLGKSWMTPESLTRAIENATERWAMTQELRDREEALRASESRFRMAAAATHSLVYELDVRSMKVNSFHGLDHLIGYLETEAQPTLEWWDKQIDPTDIPKCHAAFKQIKETSRVQTIHYRVRHKDGRTLWVEDNAIPVHDADGKLIRIVGTVVDITERKIAEVRLSQNHETFVCLVENNPFGVCVVDADFRLRQVSRGARMVFGDVHPLIGRNFDEVLRGAWPEPFASEVSARFCHTLATGEPYTAPSTVETIVDANGIEAYDWRIERIPLPEGTYGVVCYFYDLSERKRWEAMLLTKEREFQSLADSAPDILTRFNRDLQHVFVNAAVEKATGRPRQEFLNKTNSELGMPPELCAQWDAAILTVFESGVPTHLDFAFDKIDGTHYYAARLVPEFGPNGLIAFVLGVTQDVTEQKRVEKVVKASEETLRLALALARAGAWAWEIKTGTISWSPENYALYGYDEANGPPTYADWESRIHPDDRLHAEQAVNDALQGRTAQFKTEFRVIHPTDGTRWLLGLGKVEVDDNGTPVRMSGINLDISDRKRIEEELAIQDRRKDEFLATLAHELRNPLAPIRNGLEIMATNQVDEETALQVRVMMQRQVRQMVHLVDDLLDVSRINQGKLVLRKQRIELADVINSAVDTSQPLIQAGSHALQVSMPCNPVFLHADETRLGQVISNLLNNAAKYSPPSGQINLTVEVQGAEVVVKVKDTGVGIPSHMLSAIFDMFSQVDHSLEKSQGGLGIGLCLVKRLVELHEGRVEVTSEGANQGSEFTLRLPVLSNQEPGPLLTKEVKVKKSSKWRMLIVDDNYDAAISLATMLKFQGHDTTMAHDGVSAIRIAEEFRPHIILLDIGLPKMNGYDVCQCIRGKAWSAGMTIVAVTGWGQENDRRRSSKAGFDHHLVKPVDLKVLNAFLEALSTRKSPHAIDEANTFLRLLVVDDMRDARLVLSTLLRASGHDVRTAADGPTAITMALEFQPHVVLMDNSMPGMSGLEVAKVMRQEPTLKDIMLIALTGHGDEADRQRSLEAGFDHHLVKPADIKVIRELLANFVSVGRMEMNVLNR